MRLFVAIFIGFGLLGCESSKSMLVRRATYDLSCRSDQLSLAKLDRRTQRVSGCGQVATYVWACNGSACTWVLDGAMQTEEAVAAVEAAEREEARIEETRTKEGHKQLKLFLRGTDWVLYVNATPASDANIATFVWRISGQYAANDCEIKLVANGERVEVGSAAAPVSHESSIDYRSSISYASLLQIAKSVRVVGKLCNIELTLTDAQLEKTRELVMRIKETQALDEDPAPSAGPEPAGGPKEI
jgi:hypothetical protein